MKYKIEIRNIWEFGQRKDDDGRPHQEDSLFPPFGQQSDTDRFFILCDGMGGHAAGEVASSTVCNAMAEVFQPLAAREPFVFSHQNMSAAVDHAFDALDALDIDAASGKSKMGTTMTALVLHDGGATVAHMGDSRVYHIRPGKDRENTSICFQTRDHSLVNDLVAVGEITAEQAKTHPQRNVITRALQPHLDSRPPADIHSISDVRAGDYFYLCSDGMLEQMDDSNICFIFSEDGGDIDSKCNMLLNATRENRDNHTAWIIHVLDVEGVAPAAEQPRPVDSALPPIMGDFDDDASSASEQSAPQQQDTDNVSQDIADDRSTMVNIDENSDPSLSSMASEPKMQESDETESDDYDDDSTRNRKRLWTLLVAIALIAALVVWLLMGRKSSQPADNSTPVATPERTVTHNEKMSLESQHAAPQVSNTKEKTAPPTATPERKEPSSQQVQGAEEMRSSQPSTAVENSQPGKDNKVGDAFSKKKQTDNLGKK